MKAKEKPLKPHPMRGGEGGESKKEFIVLLSDDDSSIISSDGNNINKNATRRYPERTRRKSDQNIAPLPAELEEEISNYKRTYESMDAESWPEEIEKIETNKKGPKGSGIKTTNREIEWPHKLYKTDDRGIGVFNGKECDFDQLLFEYLGEITFGIRNAEYSIRVGDTNFFLDATFCGGPARFLNHSCNPNCGLHLAYTKTKSKKKFVVIQATRKIFVGEEFTIHYDNDNPNEFKKYMKKHFGTACFCLSENCLMKPTVERLSDREITVMEGWYKKNYDPSKECFKIGSLDTRDFFENELDEKGRPRCMTDYQIEDVLNYLKTTQKNVGILIFKSEGLTKEKAKKTSRKPIRDIDKVDKLLVPFTRPIRHNLYHHSAIYVDTKAKKVFHLDSSRPGRSPRGTGNQPKNKDYTKETINACPAFQWFYDNRFKETGDGGGYTYVDVKENLPFQRDAHSCGFYVCYFFYCIVNNIDFQAFEPAELMNFRKRLAFQMCKWQQQQKTAVIYSRTNVCSSAPTKTLKPKCRHSTRNIGQSVIESDQFKIFRERMKAGMEVVKLSEHINKDWGQGFIDLVLDALEENRICQALFIQASYVYFCL